MPMYPHKTCKISSKHFRALSQPLFDKYISLISHPPSPANLTYFLFFILEWIVEHCCRCWNRNDTSHNSARVQFGIGANHWIRCKPQWKWGTIQCACPRCQFESHFNKCFKLECCHHVIRVHSYGHSHTIANATTIDEWWKQQLEHSRGVERWKFLE